MAASIEERLAKLELEVESLKAKLNGGPPPRHPLADVIGLGADDPLFEEWRQAIEERRREIDADPNVP